VGTVGHVDDRGVIVLFFRRGSGRDRMAGGCMSVSDEAIVKTR